MKLFFAGHLPKLVASGLPALPSGVEVVELDQPADLLGHLHEADGILLHDPGAEVAQALRDGLAAPTSKVRWVQLVSAGYESFAALPLPEPVILANQGGAVAPIVAEHALTLGLALLRRLPQAIDQTRAGTWDRAIASGIQSLEGRTLVIVGHGHIGRNLARFAKPFGTHIIAVSRSPVDDPNVDAHVPLSGLKEALAQADLAVVSIALTPQTRHIIDREALAAIKKGAVLVNVSRGATVDPVALREALESGHLGAAGIDVTDPEPLPEGDPLWSAPNLIITPHVAGAGGARVRDRIVSVVTDNLQRLIDGRPLLHRIHV
ncbi:MAG: D-2-hydroxyacid dehydrogenase [Sphingobium sp.]